MTRRPSLKAIFNKAKNLSTVAVAGAGSINPIYTLHNTSLPRLPDVGTPIRWRTDMITRVLPRTDEQWVGVGPYQCLHMQAS